MAALTRERHDACYRFAGFELEPCERRLRARGQPVPLTPKVFDTLVLLVERAGHVVGREELMAALWPRGFVTESNLTKHIWVIRKALGGDCSDGARFIETVPKLGYRFIAPVRRVEGGEPVAMARKTTGGRALVAPNRGADDAAVSPSPALSVPATGERRAMLRRSTDRVQPVVLVNTDAVRHMRSR